MTREVSSMQQAISSMHRQHIAVKAMCLFEQAGKVLLCRGKDTVKNEHFYRVPGGHVEFGERADEAVRREIKEELNLDIDALVFQCVVENIFEYQGAPDHEVVFMYTGRFANRALYERDVFTYREHNDSIHEATWVSVADVLSGVARTYPSCDYRSFVPHGRKLGEREQ